MKIELTEEAKAWFKEEFELKEKDEVRIFVRYGGEGGYQQGFSLGITKEKSHEPVIKSVIDDVTFYIEESDVWYFDDKDVTIQYNEEKAEIEYIHGNER